MKTRFSSVFAKVALVAFALCLSSCNKEEDTTPVVGVTDIVGTWECSSVKNPPEGVNLFFNKGDKITFSGDGRFKFIYPQNNTEAGTWIISSTQIDIYSKNQTLRFNYSFNFLGDNLILRQDVNGQRVTFGFKRID